MYLTYEEYRTYGGTLDETTFTEYEYEAESQIDWYTFSRLQKMNSEDIDERVKRCVYILVHKIQNIQSLQSPISSDSDSVNAGIASQSNDGVSISYNVLSASEIVKSSQDDIKQLINKYLQGVTDNLGHKVLYRGIYANE